MNVYDRNMNLVSSITYLGPNNTCGYIEHNFSTNGEMDYIVIGFSVPLTSGSLETSFEW